MDHAAYLKDPDKGKRADLSGMDLSDKNFTGVDLTRAILDNAYISGADFRGATVDTYQIHSSRGWLSAHLNPAVAPAQNQSSLVPVSTCRIASKQFQKAESQTHQDDTATRSLKQFRRAALPIASREPSQRPSGSWQSRQAGPVPDLRAADGPAPSSGSNQAKSRI